MKYIVGQNRITEGYHICVFDERLVHLPLAHAMRASIPGLDILSAGFVYKEPQSGDWIVPMDVKSESLNMGPQEGDVILLNLFLGQGLCGLDLSNMLSYLALSKRADDE